MNRLTDITGRLVLAAIFLLLAATAPHRSGW